MRQEQMEQAWRNGHFSFQEQPPAVDPPATFGAAVAGYMGYGAPGTYYGGTTYYGYPAHSDVNATGGFYGAYDGAARDQMQAPPTVHSVGSGGESNKKQAGDEQDHQVSAGDDHGHEKQDEGMQDEIHSEPQQQVDEEDVGCMLHDYGQDCPFCGECVEDQKPEKYGGKPAVRTPAATTHTSPFIEDLTDIPRSLVDSWLPGLGMALPEKYNPKPKRPPVELCNSCGVNVAKVESLETGPGHCPECRARWMVAYRASQEHEAAKKARMTVLKPGMIVHRYAMAGRGRT